MFSLFNYLGYQAVWFAAVLGAGRGLAAPGLLATAVFAATQLTVERHHRQDLIRDLWLMGSAILAGALVDGMLAATHLVRYAAATPALPAGGAPLWILSLWAAFALTLRHSLRWLAGRVGWAALLGLVGGPVAYLGAARLDGAVQLADPRWLSLGVLGTGWALSLGALAWLARPGSLNPNAGVHA